MAVQSSGEGNSVTDLLQKLCCKITGISDDAVVPHFMYALRILGSYSQTPHGDEFYTVEKIKQYLINRERSDAALRFAELHRRLQSDNFLKNRWAAMHLFMLLCGSGDPAQHSASFNTFARRRLPGLQASVPMPTADEAIGDSVVAASLCNGATNSDQNVLEIYGPVSELCPSLLHNTHGHGFGSVSEPLMSSAFTIPSASRTKLSHRTSRNSVTKNTLLPPHLSAPTSSPECELLRDVIYTLQGIDGKFVKMELSRDRYVVDGMADIPEALRQSVMKISECGWLHNRIRSYIESHTSDMAFGLVGQSFCAALHQELTEYYRLVAVLEAHLHQQEDQGFSNGDCLTMKRLSVWTYDPRARLTMLAALVNTCKGRKGGALASAIFSFMQHGDPDTRVMIKHILNLVSQPIYSTILQWIYDGELEDTYQEFFVASDPTVRHELLWHEKYSLRRSMVPSFLSVGQARRVLLTGKSINFLRQVCRDLTSIDGRNQALTVDVKHAQSMFLIDQECSFQEMLDRVYTDTSKHLLSVLHQKYKFMLHLKAMRQYMLLGQGDFIRHLMDLLVVDLAGPAGNLYRHNLNGILETAIRATNAQFDNVDVLKRLDVRLLEISPGDTGWDVFSLDYHMDGPIQTVFPPRSMILYLRVFNFLWRAKRMEYVLAVVWKNRMSGARFLAEIPELNGIFHRCQMLGCEMQHFIRQVQYYINFEVLECLWGQLVQKVGESTDMDHVIAAHQIFLDTVLSRCLLDDKSRGLLTQLRTIFDLIIQFKDAQDKFYRLATTEMESRQRYAAQCQRRGDQGIWAVTETDEDEEIRRREAFLKSVVPSTRAQFTVLSQSYQDMVERFLVMLVSHPDISLRFLSFRLDFNQHYNVKDPSSGNCHPRHSVALSVS